MPAIKFDAGLFDSPSAIDAGPLAMYLHIAATAYCNRYATDGVIPAGAVRRILGTDDLLREVGVALEELPLPVANRLPPDWAGILVDVGLWGYDHDTGEYHILDYLERHPSKAQLAAQREQRQAAGRKGGLARGKRDD